MQDIKPHAISRTWEAIVTDRECGVTVARTVHMVTISRTAEGFGALIDGQPTTMQGADAILRAAHYRNG